MRNKFSISLVILVFFLSITACNKKEDGNSSKKTEANKKRLTAYVKGKGVFLKDKPNGDKIVNEKTTEGVGKGEYLQVDSNYLLRIIEEKDDWVKVRVISPSYLLESHVGWLSLKDLEEEEKEAEYKRPEPVVDTNKNIDLSKFTYEVIKKTKNNVSENYHIYLNTSNLSKKDLEDFVYQYRREYCSRCTINIYGNKSIENLIDIYPLEKNDYIKFADNFVLSSSFDSPDLIFYYPFQDSKYKEYGGKNLKENKLK